MCVSFLSIVFVFQTLGDISSFYQTDINKVGSRERLHLEHESSTLRSSNNLVSLFSLNVL